MPTGNTSLLGLALPVQGELSGTWGDVVNQSITELVDSAVAGTTVLSTDADVTLTTTALATNQARQAILRWTASNGATTRNITAPAQSKPYIVINAGTGSIVLRGAGPTTGVTIIAGERCLAAWNGSDFVKIATTASGAAAGSNTQVQFNSSGNLAGSANLTFDGTNLTLGGGTANGVAYLNGSKVLTTGSALTFDGSTLGINQALNVTDGTDTLRSVVSSGVAFFGSSTSAPVAFRINSAEQARLTSTGLGIGTSSPTSKLVVQQSQNTGDGIRLLANGSDTALLTRYLSSIDAWQITSSYGTTGAYKPIAWFTSDLERMRLDSSGNLGLGVTPSAWSTSVQTALQVYTAGISGNGGGNTASRFTHGAYLDGSTWRYQYTGVGPARYEITGPNSGSTHSWSVAAGGTAGNAISFTQAMTLDASGNLFVNGTTQIAGAKLNVRGTGSYIGVGGTVEMLFGDTGTSEGFIGSFTNHPFIFRTNNTERARITSAGFFGLGVTSPQAMFDLAGDYKEGVVTANTGTAYTINTATGTVQILTLTGNCTFTFPTAIAGESFTLLLRQDGTGGRTVTWPANVRWPGGTAPTITSTASRQDKYIFTADGTNWYGSNAGQNYTV